MADEKKKTNLGRGLSALLGADASDYASLDALRISKMVPIEFVHPGKFQPRHDLNDPDLEGLAQSISERGVIQPIVVRRNPRQPNDYEIVAGERRWRAAQIAKLHEVPVAIKDLTDSEALEVALVENLQRHDLNSIEEAEGYQRLMDEFDHTQERLSKVVGKSRSHVANTIRLLSLPEPVRKQVEDGTLSAGHARALLNAADPIELAKEVARRGLNVRQTELLVRARAQPKKPSSAKPSSDADTSALERDVSNLLGLKVEIRTRGSGGSLVIHYSTLEQLDEVLTRLSHGARGDPAAPKAPLPLPPTPPAARESAKPAAAPTPTPAPRTPPPPARPARDVAKKPAAQAKPELAVKLTPTKTVPKPPPPPATAPPAPRTLTPKPAARLGAAAEELPLPAAAPAPEAAHRPTPRSLSGDPPGEAAPTVKAGNAASPTDDPYALPPSRKKPVAAAPPPSPADPLTELTRGRGEAGNWVNQAIRGEFADDD